VYVFVVGRPKKAFYKSFYKRVPPQMTPLLGVTYIIILYYLYFFLGFDVQSREVRWWVFAYSQYNGFKCSIHYYDIIYHTTILLYYFYDFWVACDVDKTNRLPVWATIIIILFLLSISIFLLFLHTTTPEHDYH